MNTQIKFQFNSILFIKKNDIQQNTVIITQGQTSYLKENSDVFQTSVVPLNVQELKIN